MKQDLDLKVRRAEEETRRTKMLLMETENRVEERVKLVREEARAQLVEIRLESKRLLDEKERELQFALQKLREANELHKLH